MLSGATRSEQSTRKYSNRAAFSESAPAETLTPILTESGSPRFRIGAAIGAQSSPSREDSAMYLPPPLERTRRNASRGLLPNSEPAWMSACPSRVATYS